MWIIQQRDTPTAEWRDTRHKFHAFELVNQFLESHDSSYRAVFIFQVSPWQ